MTSLRRDFKSIGLLISLTSLIYAPILFHPFVLYDDHRILFENPNFLPPTPASLLHFWTAPYYRLYIPLAYTIEWSIAHVTLDPWPFHAASLLAHIASCVAVYAIIRSLSLSSRTALIGALFFSLHPFQCEPVNWASSFYTLLSGALGLFALAVYLQSSRTLGCLLLATSLYALALLSKPSVSILPVIAFLIDIILLHRPLRRAVLLPSIWILLAIPISLITARIQGDSWAFIVPIYQRPLIAADATGFYLWKLLVPFPTAIDYGRRPDWILSHFTFIPMLALVLFAFIAAAWVWKSRKNSKPMALLLIFFCAFAPVLGIIKV